MARRQPGNNQDPGAAAPGCGCALRGKQEPSEYKHLVLGLVFLTHISGRVGERPAHNPGFETIRELDWIPIPLWERLPVAQRGTLTPMALGDALLLEPLPGRIRVREAELAES